MTYLIEMITVWNHHISDGGIETLGSWESFLFESGQWGQASRVDAAHRPISYIPVELAVVLSQVCARNWSER